MTVLLADAEKVALAFQAALGVRSVKAAQEAATWYNTDAINADSAVELARKLLPEWQKSAELGVAFYRLYAYLMTGRTVTSPFIAGKQSATTVGQLVRDFERASGKKLNLGVGRFAGRKVPVETTARPKFRALFEEQARWTQDQFDSKPHRDIIGPGGKVWYTGIAQQIVADGARDTVQEMGIADPNVVAWGRISTTGRPCAFCAMLISRGDAYAPYRSRRAAGGALKGDKRVGGRDFHPHCKCVAIPIYKGTNTKTDPMFAQYRQFEADWQSDWGVGRSGQKRTGAKGWRSFYNQKYGEHKHERKR